MFEYYANCLHLRHIAEFWKKFNNSNFVSLLMWACSQNKIYSRVMRQIGEISWAKKYILNWFGIGDAEFNAMVSERDFDAYCIAYDFGEPYASSYEDVAKSILTDLAAQIQWAKDSGLVK